MVEVGTLLELRLTEMLLPAWPVMLYVVLVTLSVFMGRRQLCLLISYLFTFYWGFSLHWGAFLSSGTYLIAFTVYTICGLLIAVAAIVVLLSKPATGISRADQAE